MDLRTWIADEHAATLTRFEQAVGAHVPLERWTDPAGRGGSSIAWLVLHSTVHADLAINAVVRGEAATIGRVRRPLGLAGFPIAAALGEHELPELSAALDLDVLGDYVDLVHADTQFWIESVAEDVFAGSADGPAGLAREGIDEAAVPWLYRMWRDQPVSFFVQWEAIGHRLNHLGEMVSVRNRLGFSPF